MKVLLTNKKNFVIGAMGIIILLLGIALVANEGEKTVSPSNTSKLQEKSESEVAGIKTDTSKAQITTSDRQQAALVRVVDGDTIAVSINGKNETIRIIGIDTPEVVDTRKSVECFGREASEFANSIFENNKTVLLESDETQGERDRYQRLLKYVWIDYGNLDFGKLMIENGFASEYTYNTPYKYQQEYKQAELAAQNAKKGLWADGACVSTVQKPTITQQQPVVTSTFSETGEDKDCKDFSTHAEAQSYFESKGGSPTNNVDRLDADHDGLACESLP
jgi:micrococcal nuclease